MQMARYRGLGWQLYCGPASPSAGVVVQLPPQRNMYPPQRNMCVGRVFRAKWASEPLRRRMSAVFESGNFRGSALDRLWLPWVFNPLSSSGISGPDHEIGLLRCLAGAESPAQTDESHKENSVEDFNKFTCRRDRARHSSGGKNRRGGDSGLHVAGMAWGRDVGAVGPREDSPGRQGADSRRPLAPRTASHGRE